MKDLPRLDKEVVPIFRAAPRAEGGVRLVAYQGTGIVVMPGVIVTCWHVVDQERSGESYVALVPRSVGQAMDPHPITNISRHPAGFDLAVGEVAHTGSGFLHVRTADVLEGADFWTCGYPLTDPVGSPDSGLEWVIRMRTLKGNITAGLIYTPPGFPETPSIEISISTPRGLSGSPLILLPSHEIAGIIYGEHTMYMVDEVERRDPATGEVSPEVRTRVTFGLAHTFETILTLSGPATGGRPLGEAQADFLSRNLDRTSR